MPHMLHRLGDSYWLSMVLRKHNSESSNCSKSKPLPSSLGNTALDQGPPGQAIMKWSFSLTPLRWRRQNTHTQRDHLLYLKHGYGKRKVFPYIPHNVCCLLSFLHTLFSMSHSNQACAGASLQNAPFNIPNVTSKGLASFFILTEHFAAYSTIDLKEKRLTSPFPWASFPQQLCWFLCLGLLPKRQHF